MIDRAPLFLVVAGLLLAALGGCAGTPAVDSTPRAARPGELQVEVNVPPSWDPWFERDVAETFAARIGETFHQLGYPGAITPVDWRTERVPAGARLLTINLTEWRVNHTGGIDCTFAASLQTERGQRDLGLYSGMALRWMNGPGRFGLADTFTSAADDAIRNLYRALQRTNLLPGVTRR
ncbi:MAG TPA: hypothetical protein VL200_07095 [Lacunisphaera sp.]|jgi:hypothetical protein|nr:hypothetical protein [Lacunisphaera sp.]